MVTKTSVKVRGYHLDMYRHVNNARFLEFLEEGRWAFFEESPIFHRPMGIAFFVVNININYRRPATFGEVLEVRTSLSRLGQKSGTIHQDIVLDGTETVIVDADVTFAIVDSKTQKALPLDGELRALLEGLLDRDTAVG